jgi:hypothetical protein|tara:strand:+ start:970 stop:1836 length:867 start_codon:yes stop_codon:yes gene_type:complete
MMILDLNQTMISNLMAQIGSHTNIELKEDLLRHMVLNAIRGYRSKFAKKYGDMVIACDNKQYWRREVFPYYKAHRKAWREKSELDWNQIWTALNNIKEELRTVFPYKYIDVEGCEADDIIGTLCHEFGRELNNGEPILILSGDKDFVQLQKYANISQYDPVRKKWVKNSTPEMFLIEHILAGDRGDGIPNVLSKDDCFINGRQKPLRKTFLQKVIVNGSGDIRVDLPNEETSRNYHRNRQLVDLSMTPDNLKINILNEYNKPANSRDNLFNYFIEKRLKNLVEHIGEF